MTGDEMLRQAEGAAKRPDLVLEQLAQGLEELHLHALRQAADIMVRFDRDRRPTAVGNALDHVRVERALSQEGGTTRLARLLLEDLDEQPADGLALLLRVNDTGKLAQKHLAGIHMDEGDVVGFAEEPDDLLRLALPHQAVIDEDAGELLADRLMDQHGGDRTVDPAR